MIEKKNKLGHLILSPELALSLSSLFWAGNFIVGRALRNEIQAIPLNYWRWLIALVVLLPFTSGIVRRHTVVLIRQWKFVLLLAVTGIAGFHLCVYQALQSTTAINALLFLSICPVFIVIGSRLLFHDRINGWQVFGIPISLAGVVAILTHGEPVRLLALQFNPGDLLMLLAVMMWSAYSLILKRKPEKLPQTALLSGTMLCGVVVMTPLYILSGTEGVGFSVTIPNVAGLLYVSIFASVAAYFCWNYGVARLGPNKAGMFLHLMPLFGALLSIVFLGEDIQLYHLVGAVLIALGIVLSGRVESKSVS